MDEHIKREVKEEVGLSIEPGDVFDLWAFTIKKNDAPLEIIAAARICHLENSNANVKMQEEEISEYKWVNINEAMLKAHTGHDCKHYSGLEN